MRADANDAEGGKRPEINVQPFHSYQRWLAARGERQIVIPFARALADLVPASAVRARRDFKQILTAIKTLAFLSQHKRDRTADGAVLASVQDYARAHRLLAPLLDSILADGISPAMRETVAAIKEGEEISETELAGRLCLSKSTVHWRVQRAIEGGWLKNAETRRSYPAKLSLAAPLPETRSALPTLEALSGAFELPKDTSNHHSNIQENVGREGLIAPSFECSNPNLVVDEDAIELYPDENEHAYQVRKP